MKKIVILLSIFLAITIAYSKISALDRKMLIVEDLETGKKSYDCTSPGSTCQR